MRKEKLMNLLRKNLNKWILLIVAIALLCLDYIFPNSLKLADFLLIHHKSWGLIILMLFVFNSPKIQKALSLNPLTFIGKISYSFYLYHLIILFLHSVFLPNMNAIFLLFDSLLITILISLISYEAVEKPFIKLSRKINL